MRFSEEEDPRVVLGRLRNYEPRWNPHPRSSEHPAVNQHPQGPHPAAEKMSDAGESRASFDARHAAWEQAVAREEDRLRAVQS